MMKLSKSAMIRLLVSLTGALGLIALLWLLGPLVGLDSIGAASVGSVLILLLWAFGNYWSLRREAKAESSMISALAGENVVDDSAAAGAEEVQALGEKLHEALILLKKVGGTAKGGKGDSLYSLPWYLIVGPPGSGKTTALRNSGLQFPLADRLGRGPVKGVSGTRNCDWWFTDEAVLVDTAGRYTTRDSRESVDSAAWLGFLDLLKSHRPRQPINGVLIAISLTDLVNLSTDERNAHAVAIKTRLRELHEHLGIRFPVYVLFTKTDMIAGFVEFFEDLGREEREQVLGMTFALDDESRPEGAVAEFPAEFDGVVGRLNDRLLDRVHQERDVQRRALIFGFPGQFSSVKEVASRFLTDIFQPSRFETRPLLRGVYFTSGTQEGTPIDRLLGAMAAAFGLNRPVTSPFGGSSRSYFLTRLLREVVFGEASMAGINAETERRQLWLRRGAYAGLALSVLAGTGLWTAGYFSNERLIGALSAEAASYALAVQPFTGSKITDEDFKGILPLLNQLRGLPAGVDKQKEGKAEAMGLGLYQGKELGSAGTQAYRHALVQVLLPRLLVHFGNRMQDGLARPDPRHPDALRDALKAFLILDGQGPVNNAFVADRFRPTLESVFPGDALKTERLQMAEHLDALLAEHADPLIAAEKLAAEPLIIAARRELSREAPAAMGLRTISEAAPIKNIPEWRLTDHVDANLGAVFARAGDKRLTDGIPGRFTVTGFRAVLPMIGAQAKLIPDESWVAGLGPKDPIYDHLDQAILQLYLTDYAETWNGLLNNLSVKTPEGWTQSANIVRRLSGTSSLLLKLLEAVRAETVLSPPVPGGAALPGAVTDAVAPWLGPPLRDFNGKFQAINALTKDAGAMSSDLAAVLDALKSAIGPLTAAANAEHGVASGSVDPTADAGIALRQVTASASVLPSPVQDWIQAITRSSAAAGAVSLRAQLDTAWKADVLPWCKRSLEGRYPFAGTGAPDMAMDDFAHLFAPGGLFDAFFKNRLARYVNTAARPWRWQSVDNTALTISPAVLVAFEHARNIQDGFFPEGGRVAFVRFDLRASGFGPSTKEVAVDVDGQLFTFQRDGNQATQMGWPNPSGPRQAWISFTPIPAPAVPAPAVPGLPVQLLSAVPQPAAPVPPVAAVPPIRFGQNGPWAWYRLVTGRMQRTADRIAVPVSAGSGPTAQRVVLEMRTGSVINPFSLLSELKEFQCPASF
ncbi:MAG: type VI secretion system membrane subunit TssM [Rhodospirillaceae bacterium]